MEAKKTSKKTNPKPVTVQSINRQKSGRVWYYFLLSAVWVVASSLIIYFLWQNTQLIINRQYDTKFNAESEKLTAALNIKIENYLDLLFALQGLFKVNQDVTNVDWQSFLSDFDLATRYPGVYGIGYFESDEGVLASTQVTYLKTIDDDNFLLGRTLGSWPEVAAAINQAHESGGVIATRPIAQTTERIGKTVWLILPFGDTGLSSASFVGLIIRPEQLFNTVFNNLNVDSGIDYRIYDSRVLSVSNLLYGSELVQSPFSANYYLNKRSEVRVADRVWTFDFSTLPAFSLAFPQERLPQYVLVGGVSFGLLILLVLLSQSSTNYRALSLAERMTRNYKQTQRRYIELVESAPDPVVILDKTGKILTFNSAAQTLSGYTEGEIEGKHFTKIKLLPPKDLAKAIKEFALLAIGQKRTPNEYTIITKSGKQLVMEANSTPLKEDGKVFAIQVIFRDITERKENEQTLRQFAKELNRAKNKAEEEKTKSEIMLSNIADGVVVVDKDGKLVKANKEAKRLLDIHAGYYGKVFNEFFKPLGLDQSPLKKKDDFITRTIKNHKETRYVKAILHDTSKNQIVVRLTATPLKFGNNIFGALIVFRDITREEAIDRQKSEFISIVSHELRTPLSSIKWLLQLMLRGEAGKVSKDQKEYLEEMLDADEHMIRLVNDLLNVSRIESGRVGISPKPTDLVKMINEIIVEEAPFCKARNVDCALVRVNSKIPKLKVDPKMMRHAFSNVINNAIKYSKNAGSVKVEINRQDPDVVVKVKDDGLGIPVSDQENIFKKFFRAHNAINRDVEGSGLGLYFVKQIIEASGGKIWFESKEKKGTTFYISLPLIGSKAKKGEKSLI